MLLNGYSRAKLNEFKVSGKSMRVRQTSVLTSWDPFLKARRRSNVRELDITEGTSALQSNKCPSNFCGTRGKQETLQTMPKLQVTLSLLLSFGALFFSKKCVRERNHRETN